jgi:hypothetical protein
MFVSRAHVGINLTNRGCSTINGPMSNPQIASVVAQFAE